MNEFVFAMISKSWFPSKQNGNVFPYPGEICPKTKMVRMVLMNIFYRMDLEICDSKSEFWANTEHLGFQKNENVSFGIQH